MFVGPSPFPAADVGLSPGPDDPFLITGPAVLSVSGGRTSALMLRRVLDAHGGTLPRDVLAVFANTGREHPATLDFVRDCSVRWGVPIHWIEYRHEPRRPHCVVVDHASASREGEPFTALLRAKKSCRTRRAASARRS